MPTKLLFAQSAGGQQTSTGNWEPMTGLALTLPKARVGETVALVTLNVPRPCATGANFPGCNFTITINEDFTTAVPVACFSSFVANTGAGNSAGRVPTNLVAIFQLGPNPIAIQAVWQAIRGATAIVDSPCSISAVIGKI